MTARDEFRDQGYTVLQSFISRDQQERILETIRALVLGQLESHGALGQLDAPPHEPQQFFGAWMEAADHFCHDAIRATYEASFDTAALQALFWDPRLLAVVGELLAIPPEHVYLNSNRLRIDPPGPSLIRLGWHQESSYTRSRAASLQFWGPLLWPSSEENGSIEIAPGSHLNGNVPATLANPNQPGARQHLVPQDIVDRFPALLVRVDPGDLVLFSCNLFHRSFDPAKQKRMKYSLVARYSDFTSPKFSPFGPDP